MSIGRITVDLLARTGSFETDLARAAKTAEKRAKEIDAAVAKAGAAIGTALSAAGIAAIYFGKQLIDGLDSLNDVKDATGASIENISALEDVALRTGSSMENVSSILVKFNNVLKETDGKNAASQALKALGLDAEELKRIDPAEALRQTAVALSGFADDGNKARLVQELFGKSIKDAAPFLNDLAEQTSLVAKVTTEQAQAAETFNKELFAMQKNVIDVARDLAGPMVSSINEVTKAFRDGQAAGKSFLEIGLDRYWSQVREFWGMAKSNTGGATGSWGDAAPAAAKPSLPSISAVKTPKKATESEFQKYMENLEKQLQKTKELGVEETVLNDIRIGALKLQKGQSAEPLLALARQIDAAKSLTEYTKLSTEAQKERDTQFLQSAVEQEKQAQSMLEGNKSLREEIELIGKNAQAQSVIESARLSSAIAIKEEEKARLANTDAFVRETDAIQKQIDLLKERQGLILQKGVADKLADEAKKTEEFARSVGAAFESSFEKAILNGDKLSDVLQGLAKDILGLYIRNSITGPLAKSIGTMAGSGGGFDFSGIFSSIGTWFSGLGFADGGSPPVGKYSLVGENGPELFKPNTTGTIIPNHALGGGQTVVVHQNFTVGDVATVSMVREAVKGSESRITSGFRRSRSYAGEAA